MRSTAWLVTGLVALAIGVVALTFTWGRVAGLTSVAEQVPYVLSGGGTAVVSVLIGLRLLDVDSRMREGARRIEQLDELTTLVDDLRGQLDRTASDAKART